VVSLFRGLGSATGERVQVELDGMSGHLEHGSTGRLGRELVRATNQRIREQRGRFGDVDDPVLGNAGLGVLGELQDTVDAAGAVGEDLDDERQIGRREPMRVSSSGSCASNAAQTSITAP
jgi:hypothetical protein